MQKKNPKISKEDILVVWATSNVNKYNFTFLTHDYLPSFNQHSSLCGARKHVISYLLIGYNFASKVINSSSPISKLDEISSNVVLFWIHSICFCFFSQPLTCHWSLTTLMCSPVLCYPFYCICLFIYALFFLFLIEKSYLVPYYAPCFSCSSFLVYMPCSMFISHVSFIIYNYGFSLLDAPFLCFDPRHGLWQWFLDFL